MGKGLKKWLIPSMAVLLAAVPAGCESVGGLDLNKVLVEQAVQSASTQPNKVMSASFGIELDWNEDLFGFEGDEAEIAKQKQLVEWLSSITFNLNEVKSDGEERVQASGVLSFGKGQIPFKLHADSSTLLLEVDGAKRPLVIDLEEPLEGTLGGESPWLSLQNTEAGQALVRSFATYLIGHLPNPPSIEAKATSVDIHGTKTSVTQVHAELNGKQLSELIPVYLDSLSKDEEGIRKVLNEVAQWMEDLPPELKESLEIGEEDQPSQEEIEETVQEALEGLREVKDGFDSFREESGEEEWNQVFNENSTLKTDLYVDSELNVRKLAGELKVAIPSAAEEDFIPLNGIVIRFEQENWVEEGAEPIPAVVAPLRSLDLNELESLTAIRGLRLFENDSLVYDLLKNDLSVDDTSFTLYSEYDTWGAAPYLTDEEGAILLPIRTTLEGFEASIAYSGGTLKFYDEATYREVTLTIGSDKVKVNGVEQTWSYPVFAYEGVAYAYADDLLGLLGADYSIVDEDYGDLLIERDL